MKPAVYPGDPDGTGQLCGYLGKAGILYGGYQYGTLLEAKTVAPPSLSPSPNPPGPLSQPAVRAYEAKASNASLPRNKSRSVLPNSLRR